VRPFTVYSGPEQHEAMVGSRILSFAIVTDHCMGPWCLIVAFMYSSRVCVCECVSHPQVDDAVARLRGLSQTPGLGSGLADVIVGCCQPLPRRRMDAEEAALRLASLLESPPRLSSTFALASHEDARNFCVAIEAEARASEPTARVGLSRLRGLWIAKVLDPDTAPGNSAGVTPVPLSQPGNDTPLSSLVPGSDSRAAIETQVQWVRTMASAHKESPPVQQLVLGVLDAMCEATQAEDVLMCGSELVLSAIHRDPTEDPAWGSQWQAVGLHTAACWLVERCARQSVRYPFLPIVKLLERVGETLSVHGRDPGVQEAGLAALAALIKRGLRVRRSAQAARCCYRTAYVCHHPRLPPPSPCKDKLSTSACTAAICLGVCMCCGSGF
jgi:hypothetical protein